MNPIKINLLKDNTRLIQLAHDEKWIGSYIPILNGKELEEEGGTTEISTNNLDHVMKFLSGPVSAEVVAEGNVLFYFETEEPFVLPPVYLATGYTIGYRGEGPTGLATFISRHWNLDLEKTLSFISGLSRDYRGVIMDTCPWCG